jgi:hypothetical protein
MRWIGQELTARDIALATATGTPGCSPSKNHKAYNTPRLLRMRRAVTALTIATLHGVAVRAMRCKRHKHSRGPSPSDYL